MKKLLAIILAVAIIASVVTVPAFANGTKTNGYDNLNNEAGDLVIGFLGGSITVADGDANSQGINRYATRVTNWFQEEYPNKNVIQVNAGIGGTGSSLGKYRVMTDIGAHAPDVVFIEYAVNDSHHSKLYGETVRSNMETIVRNLQSLPKVPVIVFLYSMHDNSYSNIKYTSIPDHQDVADYYGIETINFYDYMSDLVEKGEFIWDKTKPGSLTADNIHPNALGHEQYGNYIIKQLETGKILKKNNVGLSRKYLFTTKDTRDIKFEDADNLVKTGTWEDSYSGQSDKKYEAIQATAEGDSISFTYTSEGSDTIGVTVLGGSGTFVVDEETENEINGTLTGANNLPEPIEFAANLGAGVHTVKIVNTDSLKLGRIIANGGLEINAASTAANGDHIPQSMPKNLIKTCQIPDFHSDRNYTLVSFDPHEGDYTSNGSYTVREFATTVDLTAGGSWGCYGFNFARVGIPKSNGDIPTNGIIYDNADNVATAGTYVFKARVRAINGNPTLGATTVKSWVGTFDNEYGTNGFAPGSEWEDYKATLTAAADGFTLAFGHINSKAGDVIGLDAGDGVYYAPEVAYDISVKSATETKDVIAGGKSNTYKASVLNQIGIEAKTTAQTFTWAVTDASGNAVEGLSVTPGSNTSEAVVTATSDVPFGTYYLKAVSTAKNWQRTLPIEVVEGPADPYAADHIPGSIPENLIANPTAKSLWQNPTYFCSHVGAATTYGHSYTTTKDVNESYNGYQIAAGARLLAASFKTNTYSEGENYVIKFAVRALKTDAPVGLRVGIWNASYSNRKTDVSQLQGYENGIAQIPADGSWEIIQGTFPALTAADVAGGRFPMVVVGMAHGTPVDTVVEFNSSNPEIPDAVPYFAKEAPHSVALDGVVGTTVATGNDTVFKAQLLNQLGLPGYLSQDNVTFTVGDAKGLAVDGLTVTNNGAMATVYATNDVPEGKYYLRANYAIDADTTWTKTLEIEVVGAIANTADFVQPEKPANLTYHSQIGGSNGANWTSSSLPITDEMKVGCVGTATGLALTDKTGDRLTGVDSTWYATGIFVVDKAKAALYPATADEAKRRFTPEANKDYVFAVKARSVNGDVKIGLANNDTWGKWVRGSHDPAGVQVGTEWTDFKTTLSTADTTAYRFNYLSFGIVTGTVADFIVVDPSTFYLAEEVAYEFNVTANAPSVAQGDVIELDATLLNQIGIEGTLSQEFTWVAVTDDRTEYLDGFNFEIDENDASKVKVQVDDNVAPGDYLIVAQNADEGLSKHYRLTVSKADYDVTELNLSVSGQRAVLDALTVKTTKNVNIVIAVYRGQKLILSNKTTLVPVDGVATLADALAIDETLQTGDRVRVFVWDENLRPFTMKKIYKTPIVIE